MLMRDGLGQKPPRGCVDYEGNRCCGEIRINVLLRLRWESPCLSFILLSICQCHSVNYCLIYLVTPVRRGVKLVALPIRLMEKWLFSRRTLHFANTISNVVWVCCPRSCSLASSVIVIRSRTPRSSLERPL